MREVLDLLANCCRSILADPLRSRVPPDEHPGLLIGKELRTELHTTILADRGGCLAQGHIHALRCSRLRLCPRTHHRWCRNKSFFHPSDQKSRGVLSFTCPTISLHLYLNVSGLDRCLSCSRGGWQRRRQGRLLALSTRGGAPHAWTAP